MQETEWIADEIERAADGGAWHGPAMRQVLQGISADAAAARTIPGAHTIWEIVHHMTAWGNEVEGRLRRFAQPLDVEADWPAVTATSNEAWEEAKRSLFASHQRLRQTIREFPPSRLDTQVPGAENGRGASFYVMLHGLAQHDAYHTGQISMLRRLARSS